MVYTVCGLFVDHFSYLCNCSDIIDSAVNDVNNPVEVIDLLLKINS